TSQDAGCSIADKKKPGVANGTTPGGLHCFTRSSHLVDRSSHVDAEAGFPGRSPTASRPQEERAVRRRGRELAERGEAQESKLCTEDDDRRRSAAELLHSPFDELLLSAIAVRAEWERLRNMAERCAEADVWMQTIRL